MIVATVSEEEDVQLLDDAATPLSLDERLATPPRSWFRAGVGPPAITNRSQPDYIASLTPLRGFAALGVVLYHARLFFPALSLPAIEPFVSRGYLWVDFFFVLSGFVLTHVYGQTMQNVDRRTYRRFMVNRIARIYPLHLAMLFVSLTCVALLNPWPFSGFTTGQDRGWSFLLHLSLLNAVRLTDNHSWNIPAWSIGAEFLTYAVLPQIVWFARRTDGISAGARYLAALGALYVLAANLGPGGSLDLTHDFGFLRCLFEFSSGVSIYWLFENAATVRLLRSDVAFAAACSAAVAARWFAVPDITVVPLDGLAIVSCAANIGWAKSMLQLRAPQILGEISYSIYLVHWLLLWVFYDVSVRGMWVRSFYGAAGLLQPVLALAVYVATVILVAYGAHRLVEKPGRTLIRKLA